MKLKDSRLCRAFVSDVNLYATKLGAISMTNAQQRFISFCIFCMTMLGSLNFAAFSVASLGYYGARSLSWMLHHSRIDWSLLLKAAILKVLTVHKTSSVHLVIDDTDRPRSKVVKILWGLFKTVDKVTGGWINAQNIVFLCAVTNKITIPVAFTFYRPDPMHSAWKKEDKRLRKKGVKKKNRPAEPKRSKKYPTRIEIAMKLLDRFKNYLVEIEPLLGKLLKIKSISFDCAYLSPKIASFCRKVFPKVQVISQIASTQIVWDRSGKAISVKKYFKNKEPSKTDVDIRGSKKIVTFVAARLMVKSHGHILHIIALKYDGETDYRYLAATELTWKSINIIRAYAFRWLIEVANFDWKQYDGWGRKAYQHGADGACRGVILSLLVDCFLLTHPVQIHQSRSGLPLWTAGSVVRHIQHDNILETIENVFSSPNPQKALKDLAQNIENAVQLIPSTKHMIGIEMENFCPSPSLNRRFGS